MKKKPSLLDIELFVQKRIDEKDKELSQIEFDSGAFVIENNGGIIDSIDKNGHKDSIDEVKIHEKNSKTFEDKKVEGNTLSENIKYLNIDRYSEENRQIENSRVQLQDPSMIDERLTSIIEITDSQRDDMNKLKQDMFKLKEQLRVYHSFLSNQQKKILEIEKIVSEKNLSVGDYTNKGVLDTNYAKLLLKNIVWLKEEKDFSSNDVARLFRAEGFQTLHPYESWDEKVINTLYNEAKKSFL